MYICVEMNVRLKKNLSSKKNLMLVFTGMQNIIILMHNIDRYIQKTELQYSNLIWRRNISAKIVSVPIINFPALLSVRKTDVAGIALCKKV